MFSNEINILVHKEQHQDRLRRIEQQRLVRLAKGQPAGGIQAHRRAIGWAGAQMVKVGVKLQAFAAVSTGTPALRVINKG